MPLEFSVAAYRFGHSMVRGAYDHNRNFGTARQLTAARRSSSCSSSPAAAVRTARRRRCGHRRCRSTGRSSGTASSTGQHQPDRFARKIDTHLAAAAGRPAQRGQRRPTRTGRSELLKQLAVRNLLRGYRARLPTGQAVAAALGVAPLTAARAQATATRRRRSTRARPTAASSRTPLWFYVLKEAEVPRQRQPPRARSAAASSPRRSSASSEDPGRTCTSDWTPARGRQAQRQPATATTSMVTIPDFLTGGRRPLDPTELARRRGVRCLAPGPHVRVS